jgi:hypothetical protein
MTPERLAQIRACQPPPFDDAATLIVYGTIQELLAEVDRCRAAEAKLRTRCERLGEANLQFHYDIERVRMEVGGTRTARIEWRVKHPLRAPLWFGDDEEAARARLTNLVETWGPHDFRLQDRLTFVGDWRTVEYGSRKDDADV